MDFNLQTAFRKQPMVYVSIAFIIGILSNKFINITIIAPIVAVWLYFENNNRIKVKEWK